MRTRRLRLVSVSVLALVLVVLAGVGVTSAAVPAGSGGAPARSAAADACTAAKDALSAAETASSAAKGKFLKTKSKLRKAKKSQGPGKAAKVKKAKKKVRKAKQGRKSAALAVTVAQARQVDACKAAPPPAGPTDPVVTDGTITLKVETPDGVPANVRLSGPADRLFAKQDAGTMVAESVVVPAGTYDLVAEPSVSQGRFYVGEAAPVSVTVAGGTASAVSVIYREVDVAREPYATGIETSSVSLTWTAPATGTVEVRRTSGSVPAAARTEGVAVPISGVTATDGGVAAGETYTYALFTEVDGSWYGPVPLTVQALPEAGQAPEGSEVFQATPSAVVFDADDQVIAIGSADGAAVDWPVDIDLPVVGTGVALPASDDLPSGFLGVVADVLVDGRTVLLDRAAVGDVFDLYSVEVEDFEAAAEEVDLEADPAEAAAAAPRTGRAQAASKEKKNFSFECKDDDTVDVSIDSEPVFQAPRGHYRMGINRYGVLGAPSGAWWEIKQVFPAQVAIDVKVSGKSSCAAKYKKGWTIKALKVPIGVVLDAKAELSFEAKVEVKNLGVDLTAGFDTSGSFDFGTWKFQSKTDPVRSVKPRQPTASASATVGAGLKASLLVGPGMADKHAEFGAIAGLGGELNLLDLSATSTASTGEYPYCFTLEAKGGLKLDLTATAWVKSTNKWIKEYVGTFELEKKHNLFDQPWTYLDPPVRVPSGCGADGPEITTSSLPGAAIGSSYNHKLDTADNRNGTWAVSSGALPGGLSLSSDGRITGTPTGPAGTVSFTVKFTDPDARSTTKALSIAVTAGGGDPGDPPAEVGAPYAGGIYVGTTQDDDGKQYALVASPRDMQFAPYESDEYVYWDNYRNHNDSYRRAPVASEWDGLANTKAGAAVDSDYRIFNKVNNMPYPQDGGSSWYVPAKNELNLLWQSLGESGLAFDYTKNGNNYEVWWLWSSTETECCSYYAWGQDVRGDGGGGQYGDDNEVSDFNDVGVRPVRRVAL